MIYVLLIAAIVAGDQVVKMVVASTMAVGQSFPLIPGFANITYMQNTGAAFSLFSDATWVLALLSGVMAVVVICILFKYKKKFKSNLFNLAMAFIAGGAIGNLIDRVAHGYAGIRFCQLRDLQRGGFLCLHRRGHAGHLRDMVLGQT